MYNVYVLSGYFHPKNVVDLYMYCHPLHTFEKFLLSLDFQKS